MKNQVALYTRGPFTKTKHGIEVSGVGPDERVIWLGTFGNIGESKLQNLLNHIGGDQTYYAVSFVGYESTMKLSLHSAISEIGCINSVGGIG